MSCGLGHVFLAFARPRLSVAMQGVGVAGWSRRRFSFCRGLAGKTRLAMALVRDGVRAVVDHGERCEEYIENV